jgi:hypothetical protein
MEQMCISNQLSNFHGRRSDLSVSETSMAPYLSCTNSASPIVDAVENLTVDVQILFISKRLESLADDTSADFSNSLVSVATELRNVARRMSPTTDDCARLSSDGGASEGAVNCTKNNGVENVNWSNDRTEWRVSGSTSGNLALPAEPMHPAKASGGVSLPTGPRDSDSGIDADTRGLKLQDNASLGQ